MNGRRFRNPRLKLGATAATALATLGFFGLMRAETPTRAGAPPTLTPATSATPPPATAPQDGGSAPGVLNPADRVPTAATQPQTPVAPVPRPRPIARTRAS